MELYINKQWTECYSKSYIAEAIAWSENGNHATIYTTGVTAKEADAKLVDAMRELKLIPRRPWKTNPIGKRAGDPEVGSLPSF
jgi:hypothetical protein